MPTRARKTIAEHVATVDELLAPVLIATATRDLESIAVSPLQMIASPAAYRDRVLAEDVSAPIDLPPFDNSAMDGYAVRSEDLPTVGSARLRLAPMIAAGDVPAPLGASQAAPIMTGAPMPVGADSVIPIESADPSRFLPDAGPDATVQLPGPAESGRYRRSAGSDVRAGELLLRAGTRLGSAQWGVLAASGVAQVRVRRRLRVLLLSTGAELAAPASALAPAQIYDSNSVALAAAIADTGAQVVLAEVVADEPDAVLRVVEEQRAGADLVVTTGGVSAGAFEVVRQALEPRGVEFRSVAMQPGGPQGAGCATVGPDAIPVVCFPGNPVSALISFEVFLRPLLRRAAGFASPARTEVRLPLAQAVSSPSATHQIRRGSLDADGRVRLVGGPSSHLLFAYAAASLLVHLPIGVAELAEGDPVAVWRIDD